MASTPNALKQWFVRLDGKEAGPFNRQQIEAMVKSRVITADTEIRSSGSHQWKRAGSLRGLIDGDHRPQKINKKKNSKPLNPQRKKPRTLEEVMALEAEQNEANTKFNSWLAAIAIPPAIGLIVSYLVSGLAVGNAYQLRTFLALTSFLWICSFSAASYHFSVGMQRFVQLAGSVIQGYVTALQMLLLAAIFVGGGAFLFYMVVLSPNAKQSRSRTLNKKPLVALAEKHAQLVEADDTKDVVFEFPQGRYLLVEQPPRYSGWKLHSRNASIALDKQCTGPDDVQYILYLRPQGVYVSPTEEYSDARKKYHLENWIFEVTVVDVLKESVIHKTKGHSTSGPSGNAAIRKVGGGYGYSFDADPWFDQFLKPLK